LESDSWLEILAYVLPRVTLSRLYRDAIGHCPFLDYPQISPDSVAQILTDRRAAMAESI